MPPFLRSYILFIPINPIIPKKRLGTFVKKAAAPTF